MKILVIGSGGREHALVWKLRQSPHVKEIYCAPGNAGIADQATCATAKAADVRALLKFAQEKKVDLTVVGPEQPLVLGIVDLFRENGMTIFGPTKMAAQLEGSKAFAKDFMKRHRIPTAAYGIFSAGEKEDAERFIKNLKGPLVVKADGLAAGKGVIMCETREIALLALRQILEDKMFGQAGEKVVIEECLAGEEVSMFALSDGENFVILSSAQDHKRILDGDLGKNTGGMGAYSPAPVMTPELQKRVVDKVVRPTLDGMRSEGTPYTGCLYVGLMVTKFNSADCPNGCEKPIRRPLPIKMMVLSLSATPLRIPLTKPTLTTPSVCPRASWVSNDSPTATDRSRTSDRKCSCWGNGITVKRQRARVVHCSQCGGSPGPVVRWMFVLMLAVKSRRLFFFSASCNADNVQPKV